MPLRLIFRMLASDIPVIDLQTYVARLETLPFFLITVGSLDRGDRTVRNLPYVVMSIKEMISTKMFTNVK